MRASFGGDPIVTLKVGPQKTPFHVHKGLLCHISTVFSAAFDGGFKENCGSMDLAEDDPIIFERLVQWLYKRTIAMSSPSEAGPAIRFQRYIELYNLADKYDVIFLKDEVMRRLFRLAKLFGGRIFHCRILAAWIVGHAYAHTMQDSRMKQFLAAWWAWAMCLESSEGKITSEDLFHAPEFAAD